MESMRLNPLLSLWPSPKYYFVLVWGPCLAVLMPYTWFSHRDCSWSRVDGAGNRNQVNPCKESIFPNCTITPVSFSFLNEIYCFFKKIEMSYSTKYIEFWVHYLYEAAIVDFFLIFFVTRNSSVFIWAESIVSSKNSLQLDHCVTIIFNYCLFIRIHIHHWVRMLNLIFHRVSSGYLKSVVPLRHLPSLPTAMVFQPRSYEPCPHNIIKELHCVNGVGGNIRLWSTERSKSKENKNIWENIQEKVKKLLT